MSSLQHLPSRYCCVLAGSVVYFKLYRSTEKAVQLMSLFLLPTSLQQGLGRTAKI